MPAAASQQLLQAFEFVSEQIAADMVGVVVRRQRADDLHVVSFDHVAHVVDRVARIDQHAFAGNLVANRLDEVGHLAIDRVLLAEVPAGQ